MPELMVYVSIPYDWKEFICHKGSAFDHWSTIKTGLVAGGKRSKEGRQTVLFTPLDLFGCDENEEEPSEDYAKLRNIPYHSSWRRNQNAVYWVKLSRAQDHGLQLWQTKSNAICYSGIRNLARSEL